MFDPSEEMVKEIETSESAHDPNTEISHSESSPNPPRFDLQTHPATAHLLIPAQTYLSQDQSSPVCAFLATGAIVFFASRVLLLQRAANDSMPNLWETPGGACDSDDPSIIHAVARELWEESGLIAKSVGPMVGIGYSFRTRSGNMVRKLNFIVAVQRQEGEDWSENPHVRTRPEEHQNFVWATEVEVRKGKVGDLEIPFTGAEQKTVLLEAFAELALVKP